MKSYAVQHSFRWPTPFVLLCYFSGYNVDTRQLLSNISKSNKCFCMIAIAFTFFSLFCPDLAVDGLSDLAFSGFFAPFPAVLFELSVKHQGIVRPRKVTRHKSNTCWVISRRKQGSVGIYQAVLRVLFSKKFTKNTYMI